MIFTQVALSGAIAALTVPAPAESGSGWNNRLEDYPFSFVPARVAAEVVETSECRIAPMLTTHMPALSMTFPTTEIRS